MNKQHIDGHIYQIDYGKGWYPIEIVSVIVAMKQNKRHPFHRLERLHSGRVVAGEGDNRYRAIPRDFDLILKDPRLDNEEKKELGISLVRSESLFIADMMKNNITDGESAVVQLETLAMNGVDFLLALQENEEE